MSTTDGLQEKFGAAFPTINTAGTLQTTRLRASSRIVFGRIVRFCAKTPNFAPDASFVHNRSTGAEKLNCKTIPRDCKTIAMRVGLMFQLANDNQPPAPASEGARA